MHPGYLHKIKNLSALQWIFTVETLFSLFFTATFAADINFLSRYYDRSMVVNIVTVAMVFSLLYVIHLISFIVF